MTPGKIRTILTGFASFGSSILKQDTEPVPNEVDAAMSDVMEIAGDFLCEYADRIKDVDDLLGILKSLMMMLARIQELLKNE